MDPDNDRKISEHVLRMHRYRNPGEQDGTGRHLHEVHEREIKHLYQVA